MSVEQPVIDAPPFRLRPFADSDIGLIQAASADPHITNISTVPTKRGVAEARAFIRRQHSRVTNGEGMSFVIVRLADDVAVGYVGIKAMNVPPSATGLGRSIGARERRQLPCGR